MSKDSKAYHTTNFFITRPLYACYAVIYTIIIWNIEKVKKSWSALPTNRPSIKRKTSREVSPPKKKPNF